MSAQVGDERRSRRSTCSNAPTVRIKALLAVLLLTAPGVAVAQPASAQPPTVALKSVTVSEGPVVVITAAGPLPVPRVGVLQGPDRIYLDVAGVASRALSVGGDGMLVLSIRVAQRRLDPALARIVIDLKQPCRYSLNTTQRASGRLELTLTSGAASPVTFVARAAPSQITGGAGERRYLASVQPALDRLATLRSVLHEIDTGTSVTSERLEAAQSELTRLRQTVDRVKPARAVEDTNDLLKSVIGFASTALSLSASSSGSPNAASAAAGALLMLDRVEVALHK
jgi:hypothetical protein